VSATRRNAFIGRAEKPTDDDLSKALGSVAKSCWDALVADMAAQHDVAIQEWKSYSPKAGWALRLLRKKRRILWLSPFEGCFEVVFILGGKALTAAHGSGLSAAGRRALEEAKTYPEGTGVRLLVKGPRDLPTIKKLAVLKLEN
jgi:hypothetical protein